MSNPAGFLLRSHAALRSRVFILILAIPLLFSCSDNADEPDPRPAVEWQPTSIPFSPDCQADCEVAAYVQPGHRGAAVPLLYNPNVNDPVAQWANCIDEVARCHIGDKPIEACVAQAACPQQCRDQFLAEAETLNNESDRLDLFERLFLNEEAYCLPPDQNLDAAK